MSYQDDEVRTRYARMRQAAAAVLTAASTEEPLSPRLQAALLSLGAEVGDFATSTEANDEGAAPDPFRHALAMLHYAGAHPEPIPLPQRAADLQRRLDGDRSVADGAPPGEPDAPSVNVVITELRAMIVAALLEELAARLSPGAAFGPGRDGEALAGVALELAKEMRSQTFLGE